MTARDESGTGHRSLRPDDGNGNRPLGQPDGPCRRRPVARRSSLWAEAHGGRGGRTGRQRPEYHLPADAGVGGDFFEAVPAADLYLLKFILHGWDDENCVKILSRCREAMLPGGRLAVISWF